MGKPNKKGGRVTAKANPCAPSWSDYRKMQREGPRAYPKKALVALEKALSPGA